MPLTEINSRELVTGAMVFTVALAWNTTTSDIINTLFPREQVAQHIAAKIAYAVFVTIVIIVVMHTFNALTRQVNHFYNKEGELMLPGARMSAQRGR